MTPTSYLELIKTFQNLHRKKVDQITTLRNRYETGLEKLDFAAGQVSVMQDQLTNLRPKLVETSLATEALMVKIEQDTVKVEAKKEVRIFENGVELKNMIRIQPTDRKGRPFQYPYVVSCFR